MTCKVYTHADVGGYPTFALPIQVGRPEETQFGTLKQETCDAIDIDDALQVFLTIALPGSSRPDMQESLGSRWAAEWGDDDVVQEDQEECNQCRMIRICALSPTAALWRLSPGSTTTSSSGQHLLRTQQAGSF
eukprot:s4017_g4.t1